ncbi:MAG: Hsp70 family protein [Planctomycetia bacterium]|jgi:hypothetical protein
MTLPDSTTSRFVVGIDLGTTNSAVCYIDTTEKPWKIRTFSIPQLVDVGQIESRETLPSFHYQAAANEFGKDSLRLPWDAQTETSDHMVGCFARDHGTMVPGRLIVSAKSWLCHSGVDRTAPLLPWQGAVDLDRLSPVEVSGHYLAHVREAWDAAWPEFPLSEQEIVLTLPASFDEVARELTVKAAATAGLARIVLIEEPQAAFYSWLDRHADSWESIVESGQTILVCDCGGGTSDFTLIRVRSGEEGRVQFHRVAVGEHLILGGDNLDITLAKHIEQRLTDGGQLEPRQWSVLLRSCRQVKETMLADDAPEQTTVNLPGSGSKLIGGGLQIEVTRDEVRQLLLDGFFPHTDFETPPVRESSGFREFGLPFTPDSAVTRYLAAFLRVHREAVADGEDAQTLGHDPARPDVILFNGGLFEASAIRERLLAVMHQWFDNTSWEPLILDHDRLDLAVARGAAYFGMVRRGEGVKIVAGLARTYYIGVESDEPIALCLVPAEAEPGCEIELTDRQFSLLVSTPVEFPLFVSSTRLTDKPGELVPVDPEQMTILPPIRTVLKKRKSADADRIDVRLHARLTEIGTLEMWCAQVDGPRRWQLQFDVRSATQTDLEAHESEAELEGFVDESIREECDRLIGDTFSPDGKEKPSKLMKQLAQVTEMSRRQWPSSLLRSMWSTLMEVETGRRRSEQHEARWLNLLGFALRPGYGLAADDWRVAETWRTLQGKLIHPGTMCRAEWWVFWRRIGGGLSAGQQQAIAEPVLSPIRAMHKQMTTGKGRGGEFSAGSHESAEVWRMLGSLERLGAEVKIELGDMLLDLIPKRKMETQRAALIWTLGRLGARQPSYGPLNTVVPIEVASRWLETLMRMRDEEEIRALAVMQLARRTDDRYRDISEKLREETLDWLTVGQAPKHYRTLVRRAEKLDAEEQGLIFGESLPKGLVVQ